MFMKVSNLRKFSLIELLVVVAIIGILSSLLLPSLGKAREKAKVAVCTNHLKQIAVANALYLDDSDGYFPAADAGTGKSWDDLLGQYDGRNFSESDMTTGGQWGQQNWNIEPGIYACPLDSRSFTGYGNYTLRTYGPTQSFVWPTGGEWVRGLGVIGFYNDNPDYSPHSRQISDISKTSDTIAYAENFTPLSGNGGNYSIRLRLGCSWEWSGMRGEYIVENEMDYHTTGKFNFMMADGSVIAMTPYESLSTDDGTVVPLTDMTGSKWDSTR